MDLGMLVYFHVIAGMQFTCARLIMWFLSGSIHIFSISKLFKVMLPSFSSASLEAPRVGVVATALVALI